MELMTGDDLIALKEAMQNAAVASTDIESIEEADEYARNNGLTISIAAISWPKNVFLDPSITDTLSSQPGLFEVECLQECAFRPIIPPAEHWQMPRTALELVQEAGTPRGEGDVASLMTQLSCPLTFKNRSLKFEEPMVRSDPVADCRALARRISVFRKRPLSDHRLPLHPTNLEEDEGLRFTTKARKGDPSVLMAVRHEKMVMHKEEMQALVTCIDAGWTEDEQLGLLENLSTYRGLVDPGYVTPPLSPRIESHTEPAGYFVPDAETSQVPEPPEVDSNLSEDIEAAEDVIFQEDTDFCASVASQPLASPERYADIDISGIIRAGGTFSPRKSCRIYREEDDSKFEVPLLLDEIVTDQAEVPARVITPQDLAAARELILASDDSHTLDRQFSDLLQFKSDRVTRSVEQEKLNPLDGTARVPIPVMDFSPPPCEWAQQGCDTPAKMFRWIKQQSDQTNWKPLKWPGNKTAEQKMIWSPLPHNMDTKRLVSEYIEIEPGIIDALMGLDLDEKVTNSSDCVEKKPGLAILRYDPDDDDEAILEEEISTVPKSMISKSMLLGAPSSSGSVKSRVRVNEREPPPLTRPGRKRSLEEARDGWLSANHPGSSNKRPVLSQSRDLDAANAPMIDSTSAIQNFMDVDVWDSHTTLVGQYAKMNTSKKLQHVPSRSFASGQPETENLTPSLKKKQQEEAALMPPPPKPVPAPTPSFTSPATPARIIASTSLSQLLVIRLQKLLPGIEIIQRDYERRKLPGANLGLQSSSNLDDADISISPATGIMVTTMVKLRQKALPGKAGQASWSYRDVVENVALRYERLIVFVSEGNKHSESINPLLDSDAKALVGFQGFAAGLLSTHVSVLYVGGGTETLAKWVTAMICQYAAEGLEVREPLIVEETCWELFLRRVGMNAYGAQAVLGTLKPFEDNPAIGGGGVHHGLPLFVMMSAEERMKLFEDVFGGRTVLKRVSEVIDEPWGQGAVEATRYFQGVLEKRLMFEGNL